MPTVLSCPKCAAPLDLPSGANLNLRCPYCGSSVLLSGELDGVASAGDSLGVSVGQAVTMAEIQKLVASKRKIEAIKLYRETFDVGLKEAKDAVERIEAGKPVVVSHTTFQSNRPVTAGGIASTVGSPAKVGKSGALGCLGLGVIVGVIMLAGFIYYMSTVGSTPSRTVTVVPAKTGPASRTPQPVAPSYAAKTIEFGSEGIGAGQFKDARSIAVDAQGHVYVAEYGGGRLQVFDSQGKFLTQWMLDAKRSVSNIAVDRKGVLYVVYFGQIMKYDTSTGELIGEFTKSLPGSDGFYQDVYVALDGSLYSVDNRSNLFQFAPDGKIKRVLKLGDKTGEDSVSFERVAVSGSGEIYLLDRSKGVFKFTSDGRYINKFVGRADKSGASRSAFNLAVDGRGRVYVSDPDGISVYDSNGGFIDSFGDDQVVFGITIDYRNSLWATLRNKYTVAQFSLPQQ